MAPDLLEVMLWGSRCTPGGGRVDHSRSGHQLEYTHRTLLDMFLARLHQLFQTFIECSTIDVNQVLQMWNQNHKYSNAVCTLNPEGGSGIGIE